MMITFNRVEHKRGGTQNDADMNFKTYRNTNLMHLTTSIISVKFSLFILLIVLNHDACKKIK